MKNYLLILTVLLGLTTVYSQNSVQITGKVLNTNKIPLDIATIYLNKAADSTIVDYTISEVTGSFSLSVKPTSQPTYLIITADGYKDFVKTFEKLENDFNLQNVLLEKSSSNKLNEIVINANVAPVKIKKDTLEFNASSFKVREDATVKSLLEQLPGVIVGDDGKIRVNGKEVNNILINGKPFFDESGKVILNNLPANMIEKVQVTDYKTKEQKQANEASTSDQKTINLTIKEDKNKGFFGNITGGYGSNERYESSLLLNYFNKDRKISVLASSNNINSLGFSNNDIFDNMASSRSNSFSYSEDGTIDVNGVSFGGGKGIYSTNMLGINYSETFKKNHYVGANYIFNQIDYDNKNISRTENLLPNQRLLTESESNQGQNSIAHNAGIEVETKLSDNLTLNIVPSIATSDVEFSSNGNSATSDLNNVILNDRNYTNLVKTDQKNISNKMSLVKSFKKKGRNLITSFNINFKDSKEDAINISNNNFYETNTTDNRNQNINTQNKANEITTGIRFKEPITTNQELTVGFEYKNSKTTRDRNAFNLNNLNNTYNDVDANLTFDNQLKTNEFAPSFGFKQNIKKGYFSVNTTSKITDYTLQSNFSGNWFQQNKVEVLPQITSTIFIPIANQSNIYIHYNYNEQINQLYHLAPVQDFSNPLSTTIGNSDLKNKQSHSVYANYYKYNPETKSGIYSYLGSQINTRGVLNNFTYDQDFKGTLTFVNGNAGSSSYFGLGTYKTRNLNEKNSISIHAGINSNYSVGHGFTNSQKFSSYSLDINPSLSLSFKRKDIFDIQSSYSYNNTQVDYKNYTIDQTNFSRHTAKILTTLYWPKNIVFGNDLTYTYNTNISDGFKKDFFLWNTSLGYKFFNERFTAKVKVYDILNQNQNVRRNATATQISDEYNTILKRYVMFSLTYKLSKFGEKPKSRFSHDEE